MSHLVESRIFDQIELSLGSVENEVLSRVVNLCPSVDENVVICYLMSGLIPVVEIVYSGIKAKMQDG